MIRVHIWNENIHDREDYVRAVYPDGIHGALADIFRDEDVRVTTGFLDEDEQGLPEKVLAETDVLIWWGHCAHDRVTDDTVSRVIGHIHAGMGFIPLHSAHHSKVFRALCGTTANLKWRNDDRERIWTVDPHHPIAQGIPEHFELDTEEMYGEPFDIPSPDEVVFMGWFAGGEVFRSGCTFTRGGRIFYFQPGHETYPTYKNEYVRRIIRNAVFWAAPAGKRTGIPVTNPPSLENN
ncbi:MAG: ThuA domain-containing protein [Oscillospiraceae bacterium]|nr:ThuA domain-containing protein [Oscillospiraceae bacterium]MBQ8979189.1 ThuA domain-containing protein [Oscillospiraceae bacterium]